MNLRQHTAPALRWSWRLALLGVALLALGRAASVADAGTASYPSPLYLSGAASSILTVPGGSNTLVGSPGPGTPATAPTVAASAAAGGLTGTYFYVYTKVDPTGGETMPSPTGTSPNVTNKWLVVNGLPTGVKVRLYRQKTGFYTRVAELPDTNMSSSYSDSMDDTTAGGQPVLPQSQNRIPSNTTGYQDFSPGAYAPLSATTAVAATASTTPNGKGWIADGSGSVSFPASNWTFQIKLKQNTSPLAAGGDARLVVGMWKVTLSPSGAISGSTLLIDPTCSVATQATVCPTTAPGETAVKFNTPSSGVITYAVNPGRISLADNEHLYVQLWRKQFAAMTTGSSSNQLATLYVYDGTSQIQHPAANGFPDNPTLGALASRINTTTPQLSAKFTDPEPADTGTVTFELRSDAACGTGGALQSPAPVTGVANGANATWTPTALAEGTYYWCAQSQDSSSNVSGWSSSSFTVDITPPNVPALTSPAASARASKLTATFSEPDTADTGTVTFQVCSDAACSTVVDTNTSASVGNGATVNWTPTVPDASYYWRVKAQDPATNTSGWSATRVFRLDTTAPAATTLASPAAGSALAAVPTLSATYVNTDAGDSGPLSFQICSDAACSSVVASGNSATLTNGAVGSWKPTSLADGSYYARVRALDVAGNAGAWSSAIAFSLDATPPLVPVGSGVAPGARLQNPPTLSATFADAAGAAGTLTFQVCSTSSCGTVLQSGTVNGVANGASANWTPGALSDGTYHWRARAQDSVGNQSAWSSTTAFVIDTTAPPPPTFTSPAAGARVATGPLTVTYTDPDAGDTSTVTVQLCADAICSSVVASNTSGPVAGGTAVSWMPSVADGTYYWRVRAQDAATNTSAWSATRAITFDTVAPTAPTLAAPADGTALAARPSLSATFTNTDAGDSGTLSFQICSDAACSTVVASGSSATLTNGDVGSWRPSTLADGTYFGRVRAVDAAGNASAWSATRGFSLDTGAPAVPVPGGPDTGIRIAHPPTLTATYVDSSGAAGTLTFQLCSATSCGTVLQSGGANSVVNGARGSWTPDTLSDGTYSWRVRAQDSAGNQSAWSATTTFVIDTTPPAAPTLVSIAGLRSKAAPILKARTTRSDPNESMRLAFQVCSDSACAFVRAYGYASADGGDATAQWQPPALEDGTYYWRAFAVDGTANESGWSATRPFVIDNTPPDVPAPLADAPERVKRAQLAATFVTADPADHGTLFFELCADADCASVIATGSDDGLGPGSVGRWTAALLRDGDYYWRARAEDVAGNSSAWSATQHVAVDTTPPRRPRGFAGTLTANTLSLRWKAPEASDSIESYVLYVNGNRSRSVDASTLGMDIRLRAGDTRSFAVAAVDSTGNIGAPTRAVVLVPRLARLTLQQAKAATADQGLLLRWSKRTSKATPIRVIGQSPAPQTIVETGTLVTVVFDGPAGAPRR